MWRFWVSLSSWSSSQMVALQREHIQGGLCQCWCCGPSPSVCSVCWSIRHAAVGVQPNNVLGQPYHLLESLAPHSCAARILYSASKRFCRSSDLLSLTKEEEFLLCLANAVCAIGHLCHLTRHVQSKDINILHTLTMPSHHGWGGSVLGPPCASEVSDEFLCFRHVQDQVNASATQCEMFHLIPV